MSDDMVKNIKIKDINKFILNFIYITFIFFAICFFVVIYVVPVYLQIIDLFNNIHFQSGNLYLVKSVSVLMIFLFIMNGILFYMLKSTENLKKQLCNKINDLNIKDNITGGINKVKFMHDVQILF